MKQKDTSKADISKILELDKSHTYKRILKRLLIIIIITIVGLSSFTFWKRREDSSPTQYITQEVKRGSLKVIVTATGTLQPKNKVDVGSELSGIIKSVHVDYNDRVKVGQVLAKLDTSKLEAQISQAKAALESAKAKVLQAQATVTETTSKLAQLKKVWELSNKKIPSQSELDAAEAALARAKADEANAQAAVSQAQATLEAYETDLSKAVIRSPINGVVLSRNIEPGQTVAASFQTPVLFTLAEDLTQMELHVNVDEADIGKNKEGQKATFTVSAFPNRNFAAQIIQAHFASTTTSGVVMYETVLKVANPDLALRPGMTATAEIEVKKVEDTILIPNAALRFTMPIREEEDSSKGSFIDQLLPRPPRPASKQPEEIRQHKKEKLIYILKDGKPKSIPVVIEETDGKFTQIVSGDIKPGMSVIVDLVVKEK